MNGIQPYRFHFGFGEIVLLLFLLGIVLLVLGSIWEKWDRKRRIRALISSGGPKTLAEYLEVFPGACQRCGFRTFEITKTYGVVSNNDFSGWDATYVHCARCGGRPSETRDNVRWLKLPDSGPPFPPDTWGGGHSRKFFERVCSPYLELPAGEAIPEFPYDPLTKIDS